MEEKKEKAVGRKVGVDLGKKTYEVAFVDVPVPILLRTAVTGQYFSPVHLFITRYWYNWETLFPAILKYMG